MGKDWIGNKASTFATLGASSHSAHDREENDYYATDPIAAELLMSVEEFSDNILEPSCGEGHLSKVLESKYNVKSTDLIYRGFGEQSDFFDIKDFDGDIITNPPYSIAQEFIQHAIDIIPEENKVCMFLKLTFLEGKKRKKFFEQYPPKTIYVSSSRIKCAINGAFANTGSSAAAYAWFVWEKGFQGNPIIKWIN